MSVNEQTSSIDTDNLHATSNMHRNISYNDFSIDFRKMNRRNVLRGTVKSVEKKNNKSALYAHAHAHSCTFVEAHINSTSHSKSNFKTTKP